MRNGRIARGPIQIEVHASNAASYELGASGDTGPVKTIAPRQEILVIPSVEGRVEVTLSVKGGAKAFAQGTLLNVTVSLAGPLSVDPERVLLSGIDVSGLKGLELVSLEAEAGAIRVSSRASETSETSLTGLAKAAEVATRELLGCDRVDVTSAINIVIAIDGSASMLGAIRDGSALAVAEVLLGVARVVSPGLAVHGAIVTDTVTWVEAPEGQGLPGTLSDALGQSALGTTFLSSSADLSARFPDQNTVTYLVTDAVPADVQGLEQADEVEGEARHLVVISAPDALSLQGEVGVPTTIVTPVDNEEGVAGRLEFEPLLLRRTIKSLLAGCFVPGTAYAKKVGK
jgi:hypothetical protein